MAWLRPGSLPEALELLQEQQPRPVCGGTDLFVGGQVKQTAPVNMDWLDLRGIPELHKVSLTEEGLEIGAGITAAEIWGDEAFGIVPALQQAARIVGGWQIQNRASLGGNVANASPAADMVVPLVAYRAEVRLSGPAGTRGVPVAEFIQGPKLTGLQPGELIVSLFIPQRMLGVRQIFLRHDQRAATDISIVSVALVLAGTGKEVDWASAAVGAAAPKAFTLSEEEELLWRGGLNDSKLQQLAELYEQRSSPISDIRASAAYRRSLVNTYIKRAAHTLIG
ncbi:xanthine dehydrogenase family protein subunit M [Paenibacillus sp. S150]|uniref:FAD binding domain-containing protein n=1 Tax=Paenibacillus sp. S150 TaxID=2749826 RepID=UPI001C5716CB|nr:FAD binding domain-containing protein [Paenibacillus sp. S150]MBW4084576.1 FAD binding domain-containing protein [Paenibacillus sp. S150]